MPTDSSSRSGRYAFAVMVKAPRSGEVKTRLVPPLCPEEAAHLSICFMRDVVANLLAASESVAADCFAAYSPAGGESQLRRLLPARTRMLPPRSVGLASSLPDAIEDLLAAGYEGACLINADSPTLPTSLLVEAVTRLSAPGDRVVLGPATDGGYYLIGLKYPHRQLFHEIDWSTERVYRQTAARAAGIGLELASLARWYDVDDAISLGWLCRELFLAELPPQCTSTGWRAPQTREYLRMLMAADVGRLRFQHTLESIA